MSALLNLRAVLFRRGFAQESFLDELENGVLLNQLALLIDATEARLGSQQPATVEERERK